MNLSEREQRFLDELYEAFPDAREVEESEKGHGAGLGYPGKANVTARGGVELEPLDRTDARDVPLSSTSQVSLFGQEG